MGLFDKFMKKAEAERKSDGVLSPCKGILIELDRVEDEVFSTKAMGDGVAVEPSEGIFHAPISGTLESVFPTGHAYGIRSADGKEILVHIGIDTVELDGKGFTLHVKQGDRIKAGDKVVTADLNVIREAGYRTTTMLIQTDGDFHLTVTAPYESAVTESTEVMKLTK